MEIATIGFTRTSAQSFFERVKTSGIKRLGDVRVHNTSQLAGFAKRDDLAYFLKAICGVEYIEIPELAVTEELLTAYRRAHLPWDEFEVRYREILARRKVERTIEQDLFSPSILLLCSEAAPERCHRRLAAEYLQSHWPNVTIRHL